ncbi:MAG: DUF3800 domain-containing protein [Clostridia bacterium]|nr:DUF3800 domain-containing protein [Clostridia bacterium]
MDTIKDFFQTLFSKEYEFDGVLYYDETNNFRKFYIREKGWNCEASNMFFVLGGLAVPKGEKVNVSSLLTDLKLQNNITDIKFRHLAGKGADFLTTLNSQKIEIFLDWLNVNELKIHYNALNYIYYSLIDIVDAAMAKYPFYNHELDLDLKNLLYEIVKQNLDYFQNVLYKYSYPNIKDTKGFMKEFLPFIEDRQSSFEYKDEFILEYLRQIIKEASRQEILDYFDGEESYIIFSNMASIYLTETLKFAKAEIIFDEEQFISELVADLQPRIKFIDSKSEVLVQLSDVVVGLISKYFSFLEASEEVILTVQDFTDKQRTVLKKLLNVIIRSAKYNSLFDSYLGGQRALKNHYIVREFLGV